MFNSEKCICNLHLQRFRFQLIILMCCVVCYWIRVWLCKLKEKGNGSKNSHTSHHTTSPVQNNITMHHHHHHHASILSAELQFYNVGDIHFYPVGLSRFVGRSVWWNQNRNKKKTKERKKHKKTYKKNQNTCGFIDACLLALTSRYNWLVVGAL